jgi:hypothetical protein
MAIVRYLSTAVNAKLGERDCTSCWEFVDVHHREQTDA